MAMFDGASGTGEVETIGRDRAESLRVLEYGVLVAAYFSRALTQATRSVQLSIEKLRQNAVIRKLEVELTARPADRTRLDKTQVRTRPTDTVAGRGDMYTIVVDFGTMVTVSALATPFRLGQGAPPGGDKVVQVYSVRSWNGQAFVEYPRVYQHNGSSVPANIGAVVPKLPADEQLITFAAEVKTEKLLIDVLIATNLIGVEDIPDFIELQLPEPPSGLELVAQDGTLVFNHPARALPTANRPTIDDRSWSQDGRRKVDLRPALAARTGDPTSHDPVAFDLTLNAFVPGLLELKQVTAGVDLAWLERIALGPDGPGELHFEEEGKLTLPIAVPDLTGYRYTHVESAKVTAIGKIGPERVVPAFGPLPSEDVEMVLTTGMTACARLPAATGLATLTGVRLALAADAGGAEVRLVVLEHVPAPPHEEDEDSEPGAPIKGGQTAPVVIAEGSTAMTAPWTTFTFDKGLEITETERPWIAIHVTRGKVKWALAEATVELPRAPLRRGPPDGPWIKLPSVFRTPPAAGAIDLTNLGARLRAIGLAPSVAPIPPFTFAIKNPGAAVIATGAIGLTPTAKGVAATWKPVPKLLLTHPGALVVEVVSHVAGNLTLRDLDLTLAT
jgi:hypothetical protein